MKPKKPYGRCRECGQPTKSKDQICLFCADQTQGGVADINSGTPIQPYYENGEVYSILGYPRFPKLNTSEVYHGEVYRDDI